MPPSIQLQPDAQRFLDEMAKVPFKLSQLPVEILRTETSKILREPEAEKIFNEFVDEEIITTPGGVSLSISRPRGIPKDQVLPVILLLHGGGWITGDADSYRSLRGYYTVKANAAVVFVNYSLSPEAKYPLALNECYDALSWIVDTNQSIHHLDAKNIALVGDSAGGNLAAALTILNKQKSGDNTKFKCQVLLYPCVSGNKFDTDSYQQFDEGFQLTKDAMEYFWNCYTDKNERFLPTVSPLEASIDELKGLAPAFVATAEADVLRDEAEEYARKLLRADVPTVAVRALGCVHGFASAGPSSNKNARVILDQSVGYILQHWNLEQEDKH